jgi:hypothetical protein
LIGAGLAAALVLGALAPRTAMACGVSIGGAPGACSVAEHEASLRKYRLGASFGYTRTRIQFSNGSELDAERDAVMASFEVKLSKRFVLSFGAGALLYGTLGARQSQRAMRPGPVLALSLAYALVDQAEYGRPFVLLTGTLAGLAASTAPEPDAKTPSKDDVGYQAMDLRVGALVGTRVPLGSVTLVPYAVVRGFGGPILWTIGGASVTGTDSFKHQLGGGAIVSYKRLDVFVEGIAVGERGLVGGVGVSF